MKKRSGSRTGKIVSRLINIRAWADWDRVKAYTEYLVNGVSRMVSPSEAKSGESFKAAQIQYNLSDAELLTKQKALWRLSVFMLIMAVGLFIYLIYQLILGNFLAAFVSFFVVLIALALAFRYHFWYFQIKNRKLGCTFKEWFQHGLMGEK